MLVITKKQQLDIVEHTKANLPNEGCGLVAGVIEAGKRIIKGVYLLTNLDQSPEHFSMDPREQMAVIKEVRAKGWELLGNFHSHPVTPARPSQEDIRLAYDPGISYIIVSLAQDQPVIKSFHIEDGVVSEEQIVTVEEA